MRTILFVFDVRRIVTFLFRVKPKLLIYFQTPQLIDLPLQSTAENSKIPHPYLLELYVIFN